jgi:hypothetical protein
LKTTNIGPRENIYCTLVAVLTPTFGKILVHI